MIYHDGHERPDVISYRQLFLGTIFSYENCMAKYEGENMERIPLIFEPNEKEIVLVTHDESVFYSNDGKRGIWRNLESCQLRKKGNGRSIMISEFLTEEYGR